MKLIKTQSKKTYKKDKDDREHHYYNYFLQFDNGKRVQIKAAYKEDVRLLDFGAEFVK